jgi:hypothetical protein
MFPAIVNDCYYPYIPRSTTESLGKWEIHFPFVAMDDDRSLPTATTDGSPSTATASDVHLKSVKEMGEEEEEDGYDYVILGTGLTECILSGLLSMDGHRVLHVDRQDHYGGDCASLNLLQVLYMGSCRLCYASHSALGGVAI